MIEVTQTILHRPPDQIGNCFSACIASIFEIPIEDVPHFAKDSMHPDPAESNRRWIKAINEWLEQFGCYFMEIGGYDDTAEALRGYHTIMGQSPRGRHAIVGLDGKAIWDPHPARTGLVSIDSFGIFISLFPSDLWHQAKEKEQQKEFFRGLAGRTMPTVRAMQKEACGCGHE